MLRFDISLDGTLVQRGVPVSTELCLGREPDCDVVLDESSISRRHATLVPTREHGRECLIVRDLGSRNGVIIDGERVEEATLRVGDTFRLGRLTCEIVSPDLLAGFAGDVDDSVAASLTSLETTDVIDLDRERLQTLFDLLPDAESSESADELLERGATALLAELPVETLTFLIDREAAAPLILSRNRDGRVDPSSVRMSRTAIDRCVETREPVFSQHVRLDERFDASESVMLDGVTSVVCVPIVATSGEFFGVLYTAAHEYDPQLGNDDLQFLTLAANRLASALRLQRTMAALEEQSARTQSLLEKLPGGIVVCDQAFVVQSANRAARTVFRADDVCGRDLEGLLAADFDHEFDATEALSRPFRFARRRPVSTHGAATCQPLEVYSGLVQRLANGSEGRPGPIGWEYIVSFADTSLSERRDEQRAQIIRRLSHKIRTPLTILRGAHELLEATLDSEDPEIVSLLRMEGDGYRRLCRMLESLLDTLLLSYGRENPSESRAERVETSKLVNLALRELEDEIQTQGLTVVHEEPHESWQIRTIPHRVVEAIVPILRNAAGIADLLHIGYERVEDEICISFTDNGPGIPIHAQEAIFEMFFQLDDAETGESPGAGLGLWWCREALGAMDGRVRVLSPPPGGIAGSRFEIFLPLERESESEAATALPVAFSLLT